MSNDSKRKLLCNCGMAPAGHAINDAIESVDIWVGRGRWVFLLATGAGGLRIFFSGILYMDSSGVTALQGLGLGCGPFWTVLYR